MMPPLLYRGSVKDVCGPLADGNLLFAFSDRYSVFDWGEMPDHIVDKGKCLAATSFALFRYLGSKGIRHHCIGLVDEKLQVLQEPQPTRLLKVRSVKVIKPQRADNSWDYSAYTSKPSGCLVPLEVIFRFGLPKGSSLLRRLASNPSYAAELGISADVQEGASFDRPLIEFSTKLEETDRFLTKSEALELSGMSHGELNKLYTLSTTIASLLKDFFAKHDIELWDGKFEFAFTQGSSSERDFELVDAIGPDELRLVYKGIPLSKEIIRQAYLPTPWYASLRKAQELAKEQGEIDWHKICREQLGSLPPHLSDVQVGIVTAIYQNIADFALEACAERAWFPNKLPLDKVCGLAAQFSQINP